jgi:hypothetical protein
MFDDLITHRTPPPNHVGGFDFRQVRDWASSWTSRIQNKRGARRFRIPPVAGMTDDAAPLSPT